MIRRFRGDYARVLFTLHARLRMRRASGVPDALLGVEDRKLLRRTSRRKTTGAMAHICLKQWTGEEIVMLQHPQLSSPGLTR